MSNKSVQITHPELGTGTVMASALPVWLARGWTLVDAEAGVERAASSGEESPVQAPPVLRVPQRPTVERNPT
jgi:hypothetical protein